MEIDIGVNGVRACRYGDGCYTVTSHDGRQLNWHNVGSAISEEEFRREAARLVPMWLEQKAA